MSQRRHYIASRKVEIVREHLEKQVPVSELLRRYGIHPNMIHKWKKELFENAVDTFGRKKRQTAAGEGIRAEQLQRWNTAKAGGKGKGFTQPQKVHEHWHTDIAYVNVRGTFLYLISVMDGYSRMILHHELCRSMSEYDVQITLQRTMEKFPAARPRLITDNGSQFVCKDFKEYLRECHLKHVRTSVNYPQSNGKIERYHRTIKEEAVRKQSYVSLEDARRQVDAYVRRYNEERLHSALYYLTPREVFEGRMEQRLAERQQKLDQAAEKRKNLSLMK